MKFDIGDKVKVVKVAIPDEIENINPQSYISQTGIIKNIDINYKYPYSVKFDNPILESLGNEFWGEYELDFVNRYSKLQDAIVYNSDSKDIRVHQLKTVEPYFSAVKRGDKTFEVRKFDRDYQIGDFLDLTFYDPKTNSLGESITKRITYMMTDTPYVPEGYVILGMVDNEIVIPYLNCESKDEITVTFKDSKGKTFIRDWKNTSDKRDAIRWTLESGDLPYYINIAEIVEITVN